MGSFLLAVSAMLAAGPAIAAAPADDSVKLVIKFVKAKNGMEQAAAFDPTSCPACTIDDTPGYSANNSRETVVALVIPRMRQLELVFTGPTHAVRRVIVEGGDVPFTSTKGRTVVQLPPIRTDAITAAEFATHVVEPGMVLRFEHADPARRAGAYATGPLPTIQREAANVLEFAQREVVRETGLGEHVAEKGLGRIQIMGFDINNPHGHRDDPPHMHMHLRWPQNTGTQIGHYYIDGDGLLTHTIVGVKGVGTESHRYERGEAFTTRGPDGRPVYTHRITAQGWLELGPANAAPCLIRPAGSQGFASGAVIACPGRTERHLNVEDDLSTGTISVRTDDIVEVIRYDRDTGRMLSPQDVVAPGLSVYVPAE